MGVVINYGNQHRFFLLREPTQCALVDP